MQRINPVDYVVREVPTFHALAFKSATTVKRWGEVNLPRRRLVLNRG
jgi:hypothetical protein